jgi:hypothetical protein
MPDSDYDRRLRRFARLLRGLAEEAHRRYCANPSAWLYLAGARRPGGVWEDLCVASECELEWDPDCSPQRAPLRAEYLPRHLTVDHLADELRRWLANVPLWVWTDPLPDEPDTE